MFGDDLEDDDLLGLWLSTTDVKCLYETARQRDMIGLERRLLVRLERVMEDIGDDPVLVINVSTSEVTVL